MQNANVRSVMSLCIDGAPGLIGDVGSLIFGRGGDQDGKHQYSQK